VSKDTIVLGLIRYNGSENRPVLLAIVAKEKDSYLSIFHWLNTCNSITMESSKVHLEKTSAVLH